PRAAGGHGELRAGGGAGGLGARAARPEAVPLVIPKPLKIGIGGPVGSGKTALVETLCLRLRDAIDMAVITNDIYTPEDAEVLVRRGALPPEPVGAGGTGGRPPPAVPPD